MALSGPEQIKAIAAKFPKEQRDAYAPMALLFFKGKRGDTNAQREFTEFKQELIEQGKFPEFQNYVKNCYMPIQRITADHESKIQQVDEDIATLNKRVGTISYQSDLEKQRALKGYQKGMSDPVIPNSISSDKKNCLVM